MPYLYCPSEAIDQSTGQCSDPHWIEGTPGGLPPLTGAEGAQIAGAIVGCWALGYVGRLIRYAMRGRIS
jgi:hypothetical protein